MTSNQILYYTRIWPAVSVQSPPDKSGKGERNPAWHWRLPLPGTTDTLSAMELVLLPNPVFVPMWGEAGVGPGCIPPLVCWDTCVPPLYWCAMSSHDYHLHRLQMWGVVNHYWSDSSGLRQCHFDKEQYFSACTVSLTCAWVLWFCHSFCNLHLGGFWGLLASPQRRERAVGICGLGKQQLWVPSWEVTGMFCVTGVRGRTYKGFCIMGVSLAEICQQDCLATLSC